MTILAAGFICGLLAVVLAIGNATLLARGDLAASLPAMVGVILCSAGLLPLVTAYLSAISGQVTTTQEISVVALATTVGAVSAAYSGNNAGPAYLATVLVTIGLTTTLCGLVMFLLGNARLGRAIRFVPFPVFGGFLAITGWYLFTGGLETVLGHGLDLGQFIGMAEPATALKVGSAVLFVILVQLLNDKFASGALLPLAVVAAIIVFNIIVLTAGIPHAELQRLGWIITVPAEGIAWPPVGWSELTTLDWGAIGAGMLFAPLIILVTAAAAMMNASGIELEIRGDVDLNRELRSMGIGNLASGLVGGIPGFPAVSATLTAIRLGAPDRAVGVVAAMVAFTAMAFAPQLLGIVPAPLLGALLMWLGFSLLIDWLIKPWRTLPRREHAIILIILAVSIAAGFPAGIVTGLLAALVVFVVEYSRVEGIRFIATGRDYHSRLLSDERRAALEIDGGAIVIMKLSGFIFFGTSDRIIQQIASRLAPFAEPARFVVLDFRRVSGIDSSTVMSFDRLHRLAERYGLMVVVASLHDDIAARLRSGGLDLSVSPFHIEPDLDAAVAWAEAQLLEQQAVLSPAVAVDRSLASFLGDAGLAKAMLRYFTSAEFAPGARLIEQGSLADDIYFIESGEGVVLLEAEGVAPVKLMAFGPGTVLGEVAFYRGEHRSASAVARTPVKAFQLSRAALARIEQELPGLAATFHYEIARALADRLQSANRLIRVLAD